MEHILIVYYSRRGENYWGGEIRNLEKGNTEIIAEMIQKAVGGDLFEIDTVKPYSTNYTACTQEAQQELQSNLRPELKEYLDDLDGYDTIFVGFPNWWSDMPQILYTFFDTYDFSGKTIVPFSTHGGSSFAGTPRTIAALEPDAVMLDGLTISRDNIQDARQVIIGWVDGLNI